MASPLQLETPEEKRFRITQEKLQQQMGTIGFESVGTSAPVETTELPEETKEPPWQCAFSALVVGLVRKWFGQRHPSRPVFLIFGARPGRRRRCAPTFHPGLLRGRHRSHSLMATLKPQY